MAWLFIDTSDDCLFLAIKKNDNYFYDASSLKTGDFQVAFFNQLHNFLKTNEVDLKEISKVGVIQGGGAYSTIRVGILFAKTLSVFYHIPLVALGVNHFLFSAKKKEEFFLVKSNDTHYFLYFCHREKMKKCWLLNLRQVKELSNPKKWEEVTKWDFASEEKKSLEKIKRKNDNKWLHFVGFNQKDLPEIKKSFLTWESSIAKLKKNNYQKVMEKYFSSEEYLANPLTLTPWYIERMTGKQTKIVRS